MINRLLPNIYNLCLRAAEPGSIVVPPSKTKCKAERVAAPLSIGVAFAEREYSSSDKSPDEDDSERSSVIEFIPSGCLFCGLVSDTLEDHLAHKATIVRFD